MNCEVRKFEEDIIAVINESPIPMETKKFVLLNVLHDVQRAADAEILKEAQELSLCKGENHAEGT